MDFDALMTRLAGLPAMLERLEDVVPRMEAFLAEHAPTPIAEPEPEPAASSDAPVQPADAPVETAEQDAPAEEAPAPAAEAPADAEQSEPAPEVVSDQSAASDTPVADPAEQEQKAPDQG